MKKSIFLTACLICLGTWFASCSKTETYAELVEHEKGYISDWISGNPYDIDFGHIISVDEDWVNDVTKDILRDSIHPSNRIELGQWYKVTEGNFKRLYFRINKFGDGLDSIRLNGDTPSDEQLAAAMHNKKKFSTGKYVLIRYDSLYLLNSFDYETISENSKINNYEPIDFTICYNWNPSYYATQYYAYQYSTGSSYECTSGGLAYPIRFLWEGGEASIICPFSLVESSFSSYYYTLYYGTIRYTKPNYLPE